MAQALEEAGAWRDTIEGIFISISLSSFHVFFFLSLSLSLAI